MADVKIFANVKEVIMPDRDGGMIIAVDFDGTCTTHDFPEIGKDIGAVPVLRELVENGHRIILYTMRSNKELDDAVKWFADNGIPLYGVNENPTQKEWTTSPKAYAHIYIDDAALGCPLLQNDEFHSRSYVNWSGVRQYLYAMGLVNKYS